MILRYIKYIEYDLVHSLGAAYLIDTSLKWNTKWWLNPWSASDCWGNEVHFLSEHIFFIIPKLTNLQTKWYPQCNNSAKSSKERATATHKHLTKLLPSAIFRTRHQNYQASPSMQFIPRAKGKKRAHTKKGRRRSARTRGEQERKTIGCSTYTRGPCLYYMTTYMMATIMGPRVYTWRGRCAVGRARVRLLIFRRPHACPFIWKNARRSDNAGVITKKLQRPPTKTLQFF